MTVVDFTQRREEELLEEVARNPYEPGFTITQAITPSQVSAINFISAYLQHPANDVAEMYSSFFGSVQTTTQALFEKGEFRLHRKFSWQGFGQATEPLASLKVKVHNPSTYNDILNKFPNKGLSAQRIHEIATNNYIQQFLAFFNNNPENILFPQKRDALRHALKNGQEGLSKVINEQMKTKKRVSFGDAKAIDRVEIILYGEL